MSKILTINNLHGEELPVWTFDFETYYENNRKGFSLSNPKLTTTMYVRDPRFKAHGCGFIDPEGFPFWVTHKDLPKFFNSIDWTKTAGLCQNTSFDGLIASHHYGVKFGYYLDTMYMSYGEWGVRKRASLKAITKRLGLAGKIEGSLEETSGIRDLSCEQERRLVPYGIQDVEQTREAFEIIYFDKGYPEEELHVIDVTLKAFVDPVLEIDAPLCEAEIEDEDRRLKALLESDVLKGAALSSRCRAILETDGVTGLMRSRPCFAELLRSRGVAPPIKLMLDKQKQPKLDENGKQRYTYAFAKTDIELQNLGEDSRVSDLVALWAGLKSTIRKNRAERFLLHSENGTVPLPVMLKYCGAHTMRWSGGDKINLQNLPSGRDGRGKRLREAIKAPPGYVLCVVDSSGIEARTNSWLWRQEDLLDVYREGGDPYCMLASKLYGVPVVKGGENSHLRPTGKAMELGLGFGMGPDRFLEGCLSGSITGDVIDMNEEQAIEAVRFWRSERNMIVSGWYQLKDMLDLMAAKMADHPLGPMHFYNDKILMPNGLYLHYENLHYMKSESKEGDVSWDLVFQSNTTYQGEKVWTRTWHSRTDENIVQCLARIIVATQALEIAKRYRIVLLVHDEVIYLVPEEEAEEGFQFGLKALRTAPEWCSDIPLDAEGGYAKNYIK